LISSFSGGVSLGQEIQVRIVHNEWTEPINKRLMRIFVQKYPLLTYYLVAFLVVTLVVVYWQIGAVVYERVNGEPLDLFGLLDEILDELGYKYPNLVASIHLFFYYPFMTPAIFFGLAPTVSALFVQALRHGRAGVKTLLYRLRPYGDSANKKNLWRCYVTILISAVLLIGAFVGVQSMQSGEAEINRSLDILGWPSLIGMLVALTLALLLDEGGLLEELGWRGFALPLLLQRTNPLRATIMVGLLWAAWHLPREVALLFSSDADFIHFALKQTDFFASGVAVSIIITYFFALSGGSVVPAIMLHGLANFLSKTFHFETMPAILGVFRFQTTVEIALALLVLLLVGPGLGFPDRSRKNSY
jgi:membrane protease YdiL (CAAX protease family)